MFANGQKQQHLVMAIHGTKLLVIVKTIYATIFFRYPRSRTERKIFDSACSHSSSFDAHVSWFRRLYTCQYVL
jgi:hypothetical protein